MLHRKGKTIQVLDVIAVVLYDGEDVKMKHEGEGLLDSGEYACLIRASDGKGTKFSTKVNRRSLICDLHLTSCQQVEPDRLLEFHAHYGSLLKASMTTLRKRDKKREKSRSEEAAKRKQRMTEPIVLDGKKRGKGRRKRQRKIKALLKQQESQKKHKERNEAKQKVETV